MIDISSLDITYPPKITTKQTRALFNHFQIIEPEALKEWVSIERRLKKGDDLGENPLQNANSSFRNFIKKNLNHWDNAGISSIFFDVRGIIYHEFC